MIISKLMGLFLLFGFYTLLAQLLLLREVSLVFSGHELSLAAALAAWLLWTAAGIRLARGRGDFRRLAAWSAALAPASIVLARFAPALFPPLSRPGLFTIISGSLALALPAALANGLAAGAALPAAGSGFYAAEAAGAAAAGLLSVAYFKLFPQLDPVLLLSLPGLVLCAAAARGGRRAAEAAAVPAVMAAFCVLIAPRAHRLMPPAPRPSSVVQTEAGRIAFAGAAVYDDGRLLHAPGDEWPELFAHIPLLAGEPGRVLISGGGACFVLPETLKHHPVSVDIAEPDRRRAETLCAAAGAPAGGFALLREDPRRLKKGGYDLVFQTEPSPENAALNRFFTREYFAGTAALMKPGGILAFQLPFAGNYVPPAAAYAAASVLASAGSVFPHVEILPGDRLTVLASRRPIDLSPARLAAVYSRRGIKNRTAVPSAFPFMLDPYRRAWAARELARVRRPPLNTDLDPLAYFRFWRAWLGMVVSPASLVGLAALALAGLAAARRLAAAPSAGGLGGEALLMGFWAMALETSLFLAFQSATGRLAAELGLLFSLFMAGGAAGAVFGRRPGAWAAEAAACCLSVIGVIAAPEARLWAWALLPAAGFVSGAFYARASSASPGGVYLFDLLGGAAGGLAAAAFAAPLAGIKGSIWMSAAAAAAALLRRAYRGGSEKASTVKV